MDIAVVTDSTAYLPASLAARHRISVVALHVVLAGRTGAETVGWIGDRFAGRVAPNDCPIGR